MFIYELSRGRATLIRGVALALVLWSVLTSRVAPGASGRHLAVTLLLAAAVPAWLVWMWSAARDRGVRRELVVLAAAGGGLVGAVPNSAASAFVFVAIVAAALRVELARALPLVVLGAGGSAVSVLVWNGSAVGLLAYVLGYAAAALAASNSRQSVMRAEQAELLLAQAQRTQEEQVRTARLEESARIARDIHDVLAHALAGLSIQLEATATLVEHGASGDEILPRLRRANALAREGLVETRRAVGALRGERPAAPGPAAAADPPPASGGPAGTPEPTGSCDPAPPGTRAALRTLVDAFSDDTGAPATLRVTGEVDGLAGTVSEAILRAAQEALTNIRKHAPGATATVGLDVGAAGDVLLSVEDRPSGAVPVAAGLAVTGGGYGLRGMRERAQSLGGTVEAGPVADGWRVELRLPAAPERRR